MLKVTGSAYRNNALISFLHFKLYIKNISKSRSTHFSMSSSNSRDIYKYFISGSPSLLSLMQFFTIRSQYFERHSTDRDAGCCFARSVNTIVIQNHGICRARARLGYHNCFTSYRVLVMIINSKI